MQKIPFSSPDIQPEDLLAVNEVINSGWLTHGEHTKHFESEICQLTGARYAVTLSSCTAGLHLSCLAMGLGPGDEVIVPSISHVATAHAVEYTGARAVFADVDPVTGNIYPDSIDKVMTSATRGIIPVHLAGYPCEVEDIRSLSLKHGLFLVEDCAHALGTLFDSIHVGNAGQSGVFSFYPTKQITTGEGGVVISNDVEFVEKVRKLRAFGIDTAPQERSLPGKYDVGELGYNYRMTDIQAALGLGQLKRYGTNLSLRKKNAHLYSTLLKDQDLVTTPDYTTDCSYFIYPILVDSLIDRDIVLSRLKDAGIGISIHYARAIPEMSYYRGHSNGINSTDAHLYARNNISLPVHSGIGESDIEFICGALDEILKNVNK